MLKWKPCPFCGGTTFEITDEDMFLKHARFGGSVKIECEDCSTDVWVFCRGDEDYDTAIDKLNRKWNTRYDGGERNEC